PPWYSKGDDHATNTHAYRMNISRQYAIACVSAAVHKGLLERTVADNDNNNSRKHMLRSPAKCAAAASSASDGSIPVVTSTTTTAATTSVTAAAPAAPVPQQEQQQQQQNETFATVEQLVSPPTIHFAPGYREGEEIVAYGTAGSSGSSGQQPQNEEYYVIGVEFKHREDDDGGPTVLWLCPYCPDRFTLYFYYRSHIKDLHHGKPFIGNPAEEAFIDARRGFNEKNMKRAYSDTWECTLCSRRGDRWYIMDHDCPHFMT